METHEEIKKFIVDIIEMHKLPYCFVSKDLMYIYRSKTDLVSDECSHKKAYLEIHFTPVSVQLIHNYQVYHSQNYSDLLSDKGQAILSRKLNRKLRRMERFL